MHKALFVRGNDAYQWFSGYSQQPTKATLSRREFFAAVQSLNLSRNLTETDFTNIISALNPSNSGLIEIRLIDEAIKRSIGSTNNP